jgi:hypothetical protein
MTAPTDAFPGDYPVNPSLHEKVLRIMHAHHLACEELTEAQMANAIRQAIESKDFQRNVTLDGGQRSQSVNYVPGMGNARLSGENVRLRAMIQKLKDACEWGRGELGKHTRPSPIDVALSELRDLDL